MRCVDIRKMVACLKQNTSATTANLDVGQSLGHILLKVLTLIIAVFLFIMV